MFKRKEQTGIKCLTNSGMGVSDPRRDQMGWREWGRKDGKVDSFADFGAAEMYR